jgi:four helix bundle protein
MQGFHELIVWQEAASLAANILEVAPHVRGFSAINAADQMVRAADSIPANIAEGYGRGISRDGLRFLTIARSSTTELESHLRAAIRSRRLPPERAEP